MWDLASLEHSAGRQHSLRPCWVFGRCTSTLQGVGMFIIFSCLLLTVSKWTHFQTNWPYLHIDRPLSPTGNTSANSGKKVMILTRYRSGSSFAGDLFSHHPDVFYMFEPLNLVPRHNSLKLISPPLLDALYSCKFVYYNNVSQMADFKLWWKRAFCTGDAASLRLRKPDYYRLCYKKHKDFINATTHLCRSFKHIAIKTIRLQDAHIIQSLIANKVKVIHLVRDPRGQMNSILMLQNKFSKSMLEIKNEAKGICTDITKMLNTIEQLLEKDTSLQSNYILVRYEDIALNPEFMTRLMYRFTGLDYRPEVSDWIQRSTKQNKGNVYSTSRNSSQVIRAWTQKLSLAHVMAIQEVCSEVMRRLGYEIMWTQTDLNNKNPVIKFPSDQLLMLRHLRARTKQ